jgi:hypothetical protein
MEVRRLQRFGIGLLKNRGTLGRLLISIADFCRPIGYFAPSLIRNCHPIFRDGALVETLIVNFIGEVEKNRPLLKTFKFENGRPTAYRICVRIHHQPDYSADPA